MADTQDPKELVSALCDDATNVSLLASYIVKLSDDVIDECGMAVVAEVTSIKLMSARIGLLAELMLRKAGRPGCQGLEDFVLPGKGLKVSTS